MKELLGKVRFAKAGLVTGIIGIVLNSIMALIVVFALLFMYSFKSMFG